MENLRSVVSKNAIIALGDMFRGLGTGMDGEVMAASQILLKVSSHACVTAGCKFLTKIGFNCCL